jgi:hypothetical protein
MAGLSAGCANAVGETQRRGAKQCEKKASVDHVEIPSPGS